MRKVFTLLLLVLSPFYLSSQALLETSDGEELLQNPMGITGSTLIGNFNISEQSAQFKSIFVLPHSGIFPNQYLTLGLKAKATNGVSTLFSGGKLNPGTNLNLSYTKMNLFSNPVSSFVDYFSFRADYIFNKFTVFNPENEFDEQFEDIRFRGGGVAFNYNNLVGGKNLFTLSLGYHYRNNYLTLDPTDIRDYKTVHNEASGISREYGKTVSGRSGIYKEYHAVPILIGYTLTPPEYEEEKDDIRFGFTLFYRTELTNHKPSHDIGGVVFLTRQNAESGVRVPVIGLGIQVADITGSIHSDKRFTERVSLNLTTSFNITGL